MIDEGMDTGNIMMREQSPILPSDNAGDVHDKLMELGSSVVVQTVEAILESHVEMRLQKSFIQGAEVLRPAPKITRELCHIDWNGKTADICNLIRGLSPYPGAFTEIEKDGHAPVQMKIYSARKVEKEEFDRLLADAGTVSPAAGTILSDGRSILAIATEDGAVSVTELQIAGKKRMETKDFLIGFRDPASYRTTQGTSSRITGKKA